MLNITDTIAIPLSEIDITAVRSQGAGGQNVNKVNTAAHLRFDIPASSLPQFYKERLLGLNDRRITNEGVIIIKAQQYRSQEQNREAALERLQQIVRSVSMVPKKRRPTKVSMNARRKRIDQKTRRGKIKNLRRRVDME